jgi:hypothetical protein
MRVSKRMYFRRRAAVQESLVVSRILELLGRVYCSSDPRLCSPVQDNVHR